MAYMKTILKGDEVFVGVAILKQIKNSRVVLNSSFLGWWVIFPLCFPQSIYPSHSLMPHLFSPSHSFLCLAWLTGLVSSFLSTRDWFLSSWRTHMPAVGRERWCIWPLMRFINKTLCSLFKIWSLPLSCIRVLFDGHNVPCISDFVCFSLRGYNLREVVSVIWVKEPLPPFASS